MSDRSILHCDCNGYFASVECLDHPAYWRVPLAVAGNPKARSGIILAKNELAKRYGVQTTETIWQARKKCPQLVLVPPRLSRYCEISEHINRIYLQYTDQVEPFSIDESYLDITGSLRYFHATEKELADRIRARVREEIGVTISVGVSYNKFFAKLGSDMKKPDATTVVTRENYQTQIWSLPIQDMLYIGRSSAEMLRKRYIETIGDLARLPCTEAARLLGKGGPSLWRCANGLDITPVRRPGERDPAKSVGNGMTFRRDLITLDEVRAGAVALSDEVAARLLDARLKCRSLQVMIRDPQLKTISRQGALPAPTRLHRDLAEAAIALIEANWSVRSDGRCAPIRALTVTGASLVADDECCEQLSLFDLCDSVSAQRREKLETLEETLRSVRAKHGNGSLVMGYVENEALGIRRLRHGACLGK